MAACVTACLGATALSPAMAAWQPTKPVEIIVPAGAGGASDQMARMMQAAIQNNKLSPTPIVVTLKGGANGGEGLMDMLGSAGDPYKMVISNSAIYTLPLANKLPFDWRKLTPVSILAFDNFVLWVNAEAPYKTTQDFVEAVKKEPAGAFKLGGTGSKREDHILAATVERIAGVKFSYIPYKSGGEAATQLVGDHIKVNVNNPSENVAVWRAGQVRALCVFDTEPMNYPAKVTADQSWKDIPTCKSQGIDFQWIMLRGVFLPSGVTPDQVAFYQDLLGKLVETPEFKDYLEKQALKPSDLKGPEMVKFLEKDEALYRDLMTQAGFVATN
ncbi:tripartite tricarboxylate transporter substrate binding protein [Ancylobacter sp. Lp-2]|uniref:Bug family tripartite tricarboxylate transporter substrate binding protein n=1 Tax=Ancylobacter sp. Lp-2 TaxID=2881339 RepID=UPI001E579432|nr:tripartite tricarboxylate transporter substrate-binding protein [Ancylobacter sp. Lp-2]MCB4768131.1 tripartite tricarboxylate transporter substrate binding protein [Ancylobacter sp. Lp-2]